MSEDIFAVRLTYKVEGKCEFLLLIVCYMTVEGRDAREDNLRKYDLVRRLRDDHRQDAIMVMGDMSAWAHRDFRRGDKWKWPTPHGFH